MSRAHLQRDASDKRELAMGLKRLSTLVQRVLVLVCVSVMVPAQPLRAENTNHDHKKREANDIAVTIVVSGIACTCARFAEDIRNVVNDIRPNGMRVLPILGSGGLQNANDVLYLKNVDMGVVDEDNLRLLKQKDPKLYASIEQQVQYITKLYNAEFHVVAGRDINSLADLQGKQVNFSLKDSQTEVTAENIFSALNIQVNKANYDNDEALRKLKAGEIAAMIVVSGAPQAAIAKIDRSDNLHFVPLDQSSLSGRDLSTIFANYLPAEMTHELYPNLVAQGESIPTIANRALLVAYAWPERSAQYKKLAKFVDAFFGKIDQFKSNSRHPKWKEINLAAEIPGWVRFKPAADWLATHGDVGVSQTEKQVAPSAELKQMFDKFVASYTSTTGQKALSPKEREELFARFLTYMDGQKHAKNSAR
jgi:TRAP transporter TAXI family solute receptor